MKKELKIRHSSQEDINFILHCNKMIEGDRANLSANRLKEDVFAPPPKAFIFIFEIDNKPIGMVLYSHCYWASRGRLFWISQLYIEPEYRGYYIFSIKRWIEQKAVEDSANLIAWGTITNASRTNRLWKSYGASNINDNYQFWVKKVNKEKNG